MENVQRPLSRRVRFAVALATALTLPLATPPAARGEEEMTTLHGQAALDHPAGRAIVAAAAPLREGRLAEVKSRSTREVREEWAGLVPEEQRADAERAHDRAPDPERFAAEIAAAGQLTLWDSSARLTLFAADGEEILAMGFAELEDGEWKVTGGPMVLAPAPVETAPPLAGAAILEHEIGQLALEYARRLEAGEMAAALELLSSAAHAARAATPASEQAESDAWRRRHTPPAALLAVQIRDGGQLAFYGERASLNVVTDETQENADGSITSTSSTLVIPFALEAGAWRLAN